MPSRLDQLRKARANATPWCAEVTHSGPTSPEPGEALLVSVGPGEAATLWRLTRRAPVDPVCGTARFVGEAQAALELAPRTVTRGLPWIEDVLALKTTHCWEAAFIASKPDVVLPLVLDGPSFGLAMILAFASLVMRESLPTDVCAIAQIDAAGRTGSVEGLEAKLIALVEKAPRICRVIVAVADGDPAVAIVRRLGAPLTVVPVATVTEAYEIVFSRARAPTPAAAAATARALFELIRCGTGAVLDWMVVERTVHWLKPSLQGNAEALWQADVTLRIARGHEGLTEPGQALPWPEPQRFSSLLKPQRIELVAHVVQSANDHGDPELAGVVERAMAYLELLPDRNPSDLKLRGAIGRALASLRRYPEAQRILLEALEGWQLLGQPADASRPLCELIRIGAVTGDRASLERLEQAIEEIQPAVPSESLTFLQLARGISAVLAGDAARARRVLGPGSVCWDEARDFVQRSRRRWLARASRLAGDDREAATLRKALWEEAGHGVEALLASLDDALERGIDGRPFAERVLAREPWLRAVWAPLATWEGWPAALANEYPY